LPILDCAITGPWRLLLRVPLEWFAVYVESPQEAPSTEGAKDQLSRNLRLARELGAGVHFRSLLTSLNS